MQGLVVGPHGSEGEDVGVREWDVEEARGRGDDRREWEVRA